MTSRVLKKARKPRIDHNVIREIQRLASDGLGAAQIQRELDRQDRFVGRVPQSLKTIRKYADQVAPRDPSAPWSPIEDETGEPRRVMDALVIVMKGTDGRVTQITRAEAATLVKIGRVAPEVPLLEAWRFARLYSAREQQEETAEDLDALLAFAPWRGGDDGWLRYETAVEAGWVSPAPWYVTESLRESLGKATG